MYFRGGLLNAACRVINPYSLVECFTIFPFIYTIIFYPSLFEMYSTTALFIPASFKFRYYNFSVYITHKLLVVFDKTINSVYFKYITILYIFSTLLSWKGGETNCQIITCIFQVGMSEVPTSLLVTLLYGERKIIYFKMKCSFYCPLKISRFENHS